MYMYKLISFALVGAASAMASGLSCKAYGVAGNLVSLDFFHHDSQLLEFTLDKTVDGHPALASTQHSKQLFQFFSCNSPSKHYKKGGQVRSLMNTSLCLTPGTVYLPATRWVMPCHILKTLTIASLCSHVSQSTVFSCESNGSLRRKLTRPAWSKSRSRVGARTLPATRLLLRTTVLP